MLHWAIGVLRNLSETRTVGNSSNVAYSGIEAL